uniref:Retroviral polymerase SH3-like domain-containing protein n=1 Tax=Tanacetum cinerariifolium TaxID=118510 RepID=A0A6L2LKR0_TANCI|nr:hypothetical protein [Tanacetum cinerariifolium]
MNPARFQSATADSKLKPRSTNHSSRSLPVLRVVGVFNANHTACITKLLKEVNSCAKIQSHKIKERNKPVDQKSHTQIPGRQIFTGHKFSPNKTSVVYEKIYPRSDLRWKPTGRIFKSVGLRWLLTGKLFDSCTSTVKSEPTHGSNIDISKIHECKQTLDLSEGTSIMFRRNKVLIDGENLEKMKEKGDECIFVGYSNQSKAYRVFNKRTRVIMESIHVNFDELPQMASDQNSSDPAPECQTMTLDQNSSDPAPECCSSAVSATDALNQRQQYVTSLTNHTTPAPTFQIPTLTPTVISSENINKAETYAKNDQVADDEFINIFSTPVQDQGETSSRQVDSSNMHTFYQRFPSEHCWTKDHPLEQVIGNPSQSVRTRRQLESDAAMCMFALTMSRTEPKNITEAMADSAWIESMQEELHQFDRLDVWELVDRPLCINVINLKWLWKNKRDEENTGKNTTSGGVNAFFIGEFIGNGAPKGRLRLNGQDHSRSRIVL